MQDADAPRRAVGVDACEPLPDSFVEGHAADKDCRHMIQRVITSGLFDRIAFTHMRTARSLSLEELKGLLAAYPEDRFTMYTEADTALRTEVSGRQPGERLYIAGSLYLVGEIKESLDHDQF